MLTKDLNKFSTKFRQALNEPLCPECGSDMTEAKRRNENQALFVWYECSRNGCNGQWLQKTPVSTFK
jgi:hypothetical protein